MLLMFVLSKKGGGVVFNPFTSATKALRLDLDNFRAHLDSAIELNKASIFLSMDNKNSDIKNLVEGTRLNYEALKKSFDGPYDRMIGEVDKIDEYSQISIKGDEKRARKERVEEIAQLEKCLTKKFKYVSEENFQEHMQKQLDTIGETGFTMDQMTTTLSMGGLYKQ